MDNLNTTVPANTPAQWNMTKIGFGGSPVQYFTYDLTVDGRHLSYLHIDEPSAESAARLIAAAPELLAELKSEHESEFMGSRGCTRGPNCTACTLIAKAEGRSDLAV